MLWVVSKRNASLLGPDRKWQSKLPDRGLYLRPYKLPTNAPYVQVRLVDYDKVTSTNGGGYSWNRNRIRLSAFVTKDAAGILQARYPKWYTRNPMYAGVPIQMSGSGYITEAELMLFLEGIREAQIFLTEIRP